jgi:prepilin-type N-terminal cleavage/methylation domain-containing protein
MKKLFIKNRGFTLIELMVVISIIGLLSSIILASLSGARTGAKNARIKAEVISLRNAFEQDRTGNTYSDFPTASYFGAPVTGSGFLSVIELWDNTGTTISTVVSNIMTDILNQNNLTLASGYAGGAYGGGGYVCTPPGGGTYRSAMNGYPSGHPGTGSNFNGLTIYSSLPVVVGGACPTLPTNYAIYAAYAPTVGSSGYFCLDSLGKSVSVTIGPIPSTVTQNDGQCH